MSSYITKYTLEQDAFLEEHFFCLDYSLDYF